MAALVVVRKLKVKKCVQNIIVLGVLFPVVVRILVVVVRILVTSFLVFPSSLPVSFIDDLT